MIQLERWKLGRDLKYIVIRNVIMGNAFVVRVDKFRKKRISIYAKFGKPEKYSQDSSAWSIEIYE